MALSADHGFMIQRSPDCELRWGPWRASTSEMERRGWKFERRTDVYMRGEVELAFQDPRSGICGIATCPELDLMRAVTMDGRSNRPYDWTPVFVVRHLRDGGRVVIERHGGAALPSYQSISMEPELAQVRSMRLADIFSRRLEPREEIIVEPKRVADLLEEIRKMQEPELAAIREKNRLRDPTRHLQDQPEPAAYQEEISASIITLRKAA